MTIESFIAEHSPCEDGIDWAKKICKTGTMQEAYDRIIFRSFKSPFADWMWKNSHPKNVLKSIISKIKEIPEEKDSGDPEKVWKNYTKHKRRQLEVVREFGNPFQE